MFSNQSPFTLSTVLKKHFEAFVFTSSATLKSDTFYFVLLEFRIDRLEEVKATLWYNKHHFEIAMAVKKRKYLTFLQLWK